MNMRIPFEISAKGVNNSNKSIMNDIRGSKVQMRRFRDLINSLIFAVNIMKLVFKDIINSRSKFSKKSSVIEEEFPALLRNGKQDMSVRTRDDIFGNIISPGSRIFETTGRAKSRLTCKRNFMRMTAREAFNEKISFI